MLTFINNNGTVIGIILAFGAIIASIYIYILTRTENALKTKDGWLEIKTELAASRDYFASYNANITKLNKNLDRIYGKRLLRGIAFPRSLQIAYVYPLLAFIIAWACGASGNIGDLIVLPEITDWWERAWRAALLIIGNSLIFFIFISIDSIENRTRALVKLLITIAITIVIANSITFAFAFAFAFASAIAFAIASAIAFAFAIAYFGKDPTQAAIIFTFFIALPFANALFDWLSWGATRLFLRKIAGMKPGKHSFLRILSHIIYDFIFALLCLVALTIVMALTMQLSNKFFGALSLPPVAWQKMLVDATSTPFGLFSILAMLFTTIAPTLLHIGYGFVGLIMTLMPRNHDMAATIESTLPDKGMTLNKLAKFYVWRHTLATVAAIAITLGIPYGFYYHLDPFVHFGSKLMSLALWAGSLI